MKPTPQPFTTNLAAAAIALAVAAGPSLARAERVWDVHAIGEVTSGYSDNIRSSPHDPPPDVPPRDDAAFSTLAPGLFGIIDSPRGTHEVLWSLESTFIVGADVGESIASRAEWTGMMRPTRDVIIRTGAQWLYGYFTRSLLPTFGGDGVVALPGGSQLSSLVAEETLSWEFVRGWRLLQRAAASAYTQMAPLPTGGGFDAGGGGGVERVWEHTSVGTLGTISYTDFSRPGVTGADSQMIWRGIGFVRQDLGERTSIRVDGGAAGLVAADAAPEHTARPIGDVVLGRLLGEAGSLSLYAGRDIGPNLYLGHTVESDRAFAALHLPLPWGRDRLTRKVPVTLSFLAGIAQARAIDVQTGGLSDPWMNYQGSAAASYSPREDLRFGVRYEYTEQTGDPMLGPLFLPFSRNLLMFSVWGRYPRDSGVRGQAKWPSRIERVDQTMIDPDDPASDASSGRNE